MGNYVLEKLTEDHAREICDWKYENEYAVYNFSDYNTVVKNGWGLAIKEIREEEFVGLSENDNLISYGRIRYDLGRVVLGVGVKPILCGKGYGKDIMNLLIEESRKRYPSCPITLEVRSFNVRAIKCYLDVGFVIKDKYMKETFDGRDEFYYMELL